MAASAAAATHVGKRLRLRLGNLGFRHLGAAGDELFHLHLGLGGKPLGLGLGAGRDGLGLLFSVAPLALGFRQDRLRFIAQASRLVELGLDAGRAPVERAENLVVDAVFREHRQEQHERYGNPEFGFKRHASFAPGVFRNLPRS